MVIKCLFSIVAAMTLFCLIAADKYYLIKSETSSFNGAFFDPSYWSSDGTASGAKATEFDPNAEYCVYKKNAAKPPRIFVVGAVSHDFCGASLVLGQGTSSAGLYNCVNGMENVISFGKGQNGLKINCGAIVLTKKAGLEYFSSGPISVNLDDGAFAYISFDYDNLKLSHGGTLLIQKGSVLTVGDTRVGVFDGYGLNGTLELTLKGSCSGVLGAIEVVSTKYKTESALLNEFDTTLAMASTDIPGTLDVGVNCHLKLLSGGDVLKVGSLSLASNTWVTIPYGDSGMGRIDVTNAFTVGEKTYVSVPGFKDGMDRKIPIITAPAGTSMSPLDFVPSNDDPAMWFSVEDFDGKIALCVNYLNPDVMQLSGPAVLGSTETWSDKLPVHEGADYCLDMAYVTNRGDTNVWLKIPGGSTPYVFAGDSLTICAKGRLYGGKTVDSTGSLGTEFSCRLLRMMDGSRISLEQKIPITISGGVLHAVNGVVTLAASNGRRFIVESTIEGAADLHLPGLYDGSSGSPYAQYEFNAENDGFMGRIIIRQAKIEDYREEGVLKKRNTYGALYNRLIISSALNLGGNLPRPEPKALLLSRYAKLIVKGDTTLSAQSNRGIFIEDIGRISVEPGKTAPYTFRMETPLAINGDFYKDGAGTLELAGSVAFGEDGLGAYPVDGKNNFIVTGGVVRVCSAGAVDGSKMLFHEGTALELAVDLDNDELLGCGIRNVKTDTPFVLGEGVEKLPVSMVFADDATPPSTDFTVAILTVSGNAAASVRAMLPQALKFPFKSYQSTLVETIDEETLDVTFGYRLKYQAMKIIIR